MKGGKEKDLKEYTWDDLVTYATWDAMDGLTKSDTLREVMRRNMWLAIDWSKLRQNDSNED